MPQGAKPKPNRFSHFLSAVAAEAQPEKKGSHSIFKNAQSAETLVYIGSGGVPVKKKSKSEKTPLGGLFSTCVKRGHGVPVPQAKPKPNPFSY